MGYEQEQMNLIIISKDNINITILMDGEGKS